MPSAASRKSQLTPSTSLLAHLAGLLLAGAAAVAIVPMTQAQAADLLVKYDQSQLIKLSRDAADVIVGNPTIADVSIQGGSLLVITGKSFGITNIIALDRERNVIQDQRIIVQRDEVSNVSVFHNGKRQTLNCTPQCNPSITIGDDAVTVAEIHKATETKLRFSEGTNEPQQNGPQ